MHSIPFRAGLAEDKRTSQPSKSLKFDSRTAEGTRDKCTHELFWFGGNANCPGRVVPGESLLLGGLSRTSRRDEFWFASDGFFVQFGSESTSHRTFSRAATSRLWMMPCDLTTGLITFDGNSNQAV